MTGLPSGLVPITFCPSSEVAQGITPGGDLA
jgi:hypothetical protein